MERVEYAERLCSEGQIASRMFRIEQPIQIEERAMLTTRSSSADQLAALLVVLRFGPTDLSQRPRIDLEGERDAVTASRRVLERAAGR